MEIYYNEELVFAIVVPAKFTVFCLQTGPGNIISSLSPKTRQPEQ